jgi:sugar phosphate isomerase/epimerase
VEIGLITDALGRLPLPEVLDIVADAGLSCVEVATGNWSEAPHVDLGALARSAAARKEFIGAIASRGLTLSALNANGNQLHPVDGPRQDRVLRDTIEVASALGVATVVCMSGLPGAPGDSAPNWITTSWPPENVAIHAHQWDEVAIPYWRELAAFARHHGVKLAVEACGGQLVHTVAGLHRLIDATDADVVGANLDPSHLMWMGADIPTVINSLAGSIFNVHAKDVRVNRAVAARDGLLDPTSISRARDRAWNYVTLGLGHPQGEAFWADFVYQLRAAGYDGVLSIEHEDTLVSAREGVARAAALLRRVALVEAPDWAPADI